VTVCTQCAARRNIAPDDLITGVRIAGAATFVAEIMTEGAQALVYLAGPDSAVPVAPLITTRHPSLFGPGTKSKR
jgi:hypothetical protein